MTKQRRVILDELEKLNSHPTAADMYNVVRQRLPRISLGTVYRNLELLADSGVVRKVQIGSREARFDAILAEHHHIFCIECNRVDDIPGSPEVDPKVVQANPKGWQVKELKVELAGICPDCAFRSGNLNS